MPDALRWHAALFACGAVALTLLNVLRTPDRLWFWAPLLVWTALLALHGWSIVHPPLAPSATGAGEAAPVAPATITAPPASVVEPTAADPLPAAPMTPRRLPAAAELAALRLSLDPWATSALAAENARPEELPDSVLALWRLTPEPAVPAPIAAETTPPSRPSVDLQALGWI
ncbi:MAG TPA: 2TM domain-containing protein [Thermomicrobiales bacterium]|nr:2TM domain-containing protein [Thermomicrobiales bacterium]